jgi:hypothetical protein
VRMAGEGLPETGGLGAGEGQGDVDGSEERRQHAGPVEIEEVTASLPAAGTDGDQVEELAVLILGTVEGQQTLQGAPVQVLVLQARSSFQDSPSGSLEGYRLPARMAR